MIKLISRVGLSIIAGASGQLLMKVAMTQFPPLSEWLPTLSTLTATQYIEPIAFLTGGISCYIIAMLLWLRVLRDLPLHYAYPLLSLGYVLVYFGAHFLPSLNEPLTHQKTIGVSLIMLGVIVMTNKPKDLS